MIRHHYIACCYNVSNIYIVPYVLLSVLCPLRNGMLKNYHTRITTTAFLKHSRITKNTYLHTIPEVDTKLE